MKLIRPVLTAPVVCIMFAAPVAGQTAGTIEIIGLREWTIPMLRDSIRRYRPDVSLGDAACAEVLRDSLGFPDAAVFRFRDGRVVLTVIEPADSHRVVLRPMPKGPAGPGAWDSIRSLQKDAPFAVEYAVATFPRWKAGRDVPIEPTDSAIVRRVRELLAAPESLNDWKSAIEALVSNSDPAARRAAASYLVRYPERDSTWHMLVHALRDPDWGVRGDANGVLRAFRQSALRKLDWTPAAADLRHLLDGTSLVYQIEVVRLLLATEVSPDLTSGLLSRDGTRLLLAQAAANHEYLKEPATAFLRYISGIDPATNPAGWQQWIEMRLGTAQ